MEKICNEKNGTISLTFNSFNKDKIEKIIKEFEKEKKYLNKIEEYISKDKKIIKLNNKPYYKKGKWD